MKRKIMLLTILIIIVSVSLMGCKKGTKDSSSEPEKIKEEDIVEMDDILASDLESVISEEETPFTKVMEDGETVYLDESSPEILTVEMFLAEYGKAKFNVDYKEHDGRELVDFLTPEALEEFNKNERDKDAVEAYKKAKLVENFIGIHEIKSIEFKNNTATVDVDFVSVYDEIKAKGYEVGTYYYKPEKLLLKLIDNNWKVQAFLEVGIPYYLDEEGD